MASEKKRKSRMVNVFGKLLFFLTLMILLSVISTPLTAVEVEGKLTHHLSEDEKASMPAYLQSERQRRSAVAPPPYPVRGIAEFEPMEGVLIAFPLGIPVTMVKEMAQDIVVYTLVRSASDEIRARGMFGAAGVNLANCIFVIADTDGYWTRDYGPWFVSTGSGTIDIIDFTYNRPRPNDNNIPSVMAVFLNMGLHKMDLVHCGGNYMTDGMGNAVSTTLVWDENNLYSAQQIDQIVKDYLGIQTYHVKADPTGSYIQHVDTWAKYLDVDKVIVAQVSQSDSQYAEYEASAAYFSAIASAYGNNYQVYRVQTPNYEPYTNALILNHKVLVPLTGSAQDSAAIARYESAMPGYTIIGIPSGSWYPTDALHCRAKGIADREMVYIHHLPLWGEIPQQNGYAVSAEITAYSGQPLNNNAISVYYQIDGGLYNQLPMDLTSGNTFSATIPTQPDGSKVAYYIHAEDVGGKSNNHPFIGAPDPHIFSVGTSVPQIPVAQFSADPVVISAGGSVQFSDQSTGVPTSWHWDFGDNTTSAAQHPVHTYTTEGVYSVTLTVSNAAGTDTVIRHGLVTVSKAPYCQASGTSFDYEWIAGVDMGGITNTSTASGYTDFTHITASATAGSSFPVRLTPGYQGQIYSEYWRIWIDWNNDGDFIDAGETVYSGFGSSTVSGSFPVPSNTKGTTRMRIAMGYGSYPQPCGTFAYGEVEDYTIKVN